MIVGDLNIKSVAVLPSKADAVLIIDSDTALSRAISLQPLQPVRWWRREVSKVLRAIDLNQSPERERGDGLKSPHAAPLENRFRSPIAKRTDQTNIILRIALYARRGKRESEARIGVEPTK